MSRASALAVLMLVLLAVPRDSVAQVYRWTDEQGTPHYAEGLSNVPERYRSQVESLGNRNLRPPAFGPGAGGERTTIRYTPGQPIIVDVRLNGRTSAQLVLDTGAGSTLISPRTLSAAGVSLRDPVAQGRVTGVTGSDRVFYVVVDSLEVGNARVVDMPVMSYEIAGLPHDGLLGRDFLDRFAVTIDSTRGEVTLAPK